MLSVALSTAPASVQVKVRIGKNLDHVLIHGVDLQNHIITKNKIKRYQGRKKLRFNCQRNQPLAKKHSPARSSQLSHWDYLLEKPTLPRPSAANNIQ